MKVLAYPADDYGCGHHRIIWPCEVLKTEHDVDVTVVRAADRHVLTHYRGDELVRVDVEPDVDVIVFQRPTDRRLVEMARWLRTNGYTVIVDVDDDLAAIHPGNPAFTFLDPNRAKHDVQAALRERRLKPEQADAVYTMLLRKYTHSWLNVTETCKLASLVTVSTPGLLRRYAAHGRGVVLPNYVPEHYLQVRHDDSNLLGWPAALHSHPNDPTALGNALARLVAEHARFSTIGDSHGVTAAFNLPLRDEHGEVLEPPGGDVSLPRWPTALAKLGVGIAPLADTLFNSRKSWLKPLEMSAVGVPWVASPRVEYRRLHEQYGAGLLVDKPRQWYSTLRELLDSPTRRQDLSEAGRAAAGQLRLVNHAWRWAEAWQTALDQDRLATTVPRRAETIEAL